MTNEPTATEPVPGQLAGTPLRAGAITITQAESTALAQVLGTPEPEDGTLHPLFGYIAPQRGIGETIPELCALADFDIDDGPMLGTIDIELDEELIPNVEYQVEGEVVGLVRKQGRSGAFDLFTFTERLARDGRTVATSTVTFVLPRRGTSEQERHA